MPARNSQLDRKLNFVANRIVKADELIRVQDLDQSREVRGLGSLFNQGATLNVKLTVDGTSVSLAAIVAGAPMWVFLNGSWEQIEPVTFALDPSKTTGEDVIYLNWALWRVTADGASGTIADPSLVDVSTGEPTAETGQLELSVAVEDTSSVALNETTQLAKNTSPIVMYRLARGDGGSITAAATARVADPALASAALAGFVKLTTATSGGVAVATDDPRLTFDIPMWFIKDYHVSKVTNTTPLKQTPFTQGFGLTEMDTTGAQGISSACIYDIATKTRLADFMGMVVSLLTDAYLKANALWSGKSSSSGSGSGSGYTPPPAPSVPSDHVGAALGTAASHPARVNSDTDGFSVVRSGTGEGSATAPAFAVKGSDGSVLGGLMHNGDVQVKKAEASVIGSTKLNTLVAIAAALAGHVNNHPTGEGSGATQAYVDAQDTAKLGEAKAYADQLLSGGGTTVEYRDEATNLNWKIIRIGNLELAFAFGEAQDGTTIQMPDGFSAGVFAGTASWGRTFSLQNAAQMHCYMDGVNVVAFIQDAEGGRSSGDWANVQGMVYRWV